MYLKVRTDQPFKSNSENITQTIVDFWDKTSNAWKTIWGPHIHHGFYPKSELQTPLEAQVLLIKQLIELLSIQPRSKILDVGCGMGGSSIYLAKNYEALVTGITLSPKQVDIAVHQAQLENISNIDFKIENALSLKSFEDKSFDILWSLESCEQFYNKKLFIEQAFRVLKPGGKLMLATWCSDKEEYEGFLAQKYKNLCVAYDLPYMPTIEHYCHLLQQQNFILNQSLDWTEHVKKSWDVGVSLISAYNFVKLFKMLGLRAFNAVKQIKMMREAFYYQRIRYGVFIAVKPEFKREL